MKITLKRMYEASSESNAGFLSFKKKLQNWRKEGVIFFIGNVYSLQLSEYIEFYFYKTSSKYSEPKAFPIPATQFVKYKTRKEQYEFVRDYYQAYYPEREFPMQEFYTYEDTPFFGSKFVWYYKS